MILIQTLDLFLFVACLSAAWYFLFRLVPRMGQKVALCMLHSMRDRLYVYARKSAYSQDSLLYNDMIFGLTGLIYAIRDIPPNEAVVRVSKLLSRRKHQTDISDVDWRSRRYELELQRVEQSYEELKLLDKAVDTYMRRNLPLFIFVCTFHPFIFIPGIFLTLAALPFAAVLILFRSVFALLLPKHGKAAVENIMSVRDGIESVRRMESRNRLGNQFT